MDEKVSLVDLGRSLWANRRIVIACTAGALVVSALISLVLPQWYKATASILPPESTIDQPDIIGIMRYAGVRPAQLPTVTTPSDIYSAILRSNRVAEAVIDSLGLMKVYKAKALKDAKERVFDNIHVSITPEGLVEVAYEDTDRGRSADVANAFVRELDRFNRESKVTTAKRVRELVEERLVEVAAELDKAETALKDFKQTTGAVFISEQAAASIKTAAGIYGTIAELEVKLEQLKQFATERSPEVLDVRLQIRSLRHKLAEMGYIGSDSTQAESGSLFPRFDAAPGLEKELADLTMTVEIKRAVYKVLSEQYEEARIQEMRNSPTVQILDWAQPPPVRSKPKRKVIVGVSTVAALFLSSAVVLRRERSFRPIS
jgi:tyrosine-protein kinase Etk/Wzc